MVWRRVSLLSLSLGAIVFAACGGGSKGGPDPVTTTTARSTTTTSVAQVQAQRYVGTFQQPAPAPALPLDLTVFFNLPRASVLKSVISPRAVFDITGGYNTGPGGFTGSITGSFDGTVEGGGTFTGVMTANLASGCVARRNYSGPLTPQSLNWTPGTQLETCGGSSPLAASINAPASTQPPSTSIVATTTTTSAPSTTTTSVGGTTTTTAGPSTTTTSVGPSTTTTVLGPTTTTTTAPSLLCGFSGVPTSNFTPTGGSGGGQVGTNPSSATCSPALSGVCSWITASVSQSSNGVFDSYSLQANATNSPPRSCTYTIFNSLNASDSTTRTINQSAQYDVSLTLSGTAVYTVTSPQISSVNCTHPAGAGPVSCPLFAFGTIQLVSNVAVTSITGCDSTSGGTTCTLNMTSTKSVVFTK